MCSDNVLLFSITLEHIVFPHLEIYLNVVLLLFFTFGVLVLLLLYISLCVVCAQKCVIWPWNLQ